MCSARTLYSFDGIELVISLFTTGDLWARLLPVAVGNWC
jgi:hypothetical protein